MDNITINAITVGEHALGAARIIMCLISDVRGRETTALITERDKKTLKRASNKLNKALSAIEKISENTGYYAIMCNFTKYRIVIGALNKTVKETVSSDEWTTEQLRLLDDLSGQVVYSIMISERY